MPKEVAIVGAGMTTQNLPKYELQEELVAEALRSLLEDNPRIDLKKIDCHIASYFSDHFEQQLSMHWIINDYIGLSSKPVFRVESGGATPMDAVVAAYWAIKSGIYDICLVTGWEKMSEVDTSKVNEFIALASDTDFDFPVGGYYTGYYATMEARRMFLWGETEEDLARVAVKNRNNSLLNPYAQWKAQYGKPITIEDVLNSRLVAWPYKILDCALISDGASAIVLAEGKKAKQLSDKPVWITGVGLGSDTMRPGDRLDNPVWHSIFPELMDKYPDVKTKPLTPYPEMTGLAAVRAAAAEAYKMAGVKNPRKEFGIVECLAPYTGIELTLYEDLLLCDVGQGKEMIRSGETEIGGSLPVNISGGVMAQSHPVGATSINQIAVLYWELRKEMEEKFGTAKVQVDNPKKALVQGHGGTGAVAAVAVLEL